MPDEFAAQGGAQDELVVAGEAGDARAGAGLHHGEGRAGALDLAGGAGEQLTRLGEVHAEDGGDLVGGELVAHGEFERLALLGVVPAASGQASRASSSWRCAWASSDTGALSASAARRSAAPLACRLEVSLWGARRLEACAAWRLRRASVSLRRQDQRASAYSHALRSSADSGPRGLRRSASARTSPRAAVAASWSQSTDRQ